MSKATDTTADAQSTSHRADFEDVPFAVEHYERGTDSAQSFIDSLVTALDDYTQEKRIVSVKAHCSSHHVVVIRLTDKVSERLAAFLRQTDYDFCVMPGQMNGPSLKVLVDTSDRCDE